jgi:PAT family beta-lactamase induction signal transducer AmpG
MPAEDGGGWRSFLPAPVRPYSEAAPLAALFLGISSGAPYAMIGATLTSRLAQDGIEKSSVTAFALTLLVYNLKWAWAWILDSLHLPVIGRLGQRVSWLVLTGALVIAAIVNLGLTEPTASLAATAVAAVLVAVAGASFDIVIDAYRIELLEPRQLGIGSGMSQYGWRIGAAAAGGLALVVAQGAGWAPAYIACALFALPAIVTGFVLGEPRRHREPAERQGLAAVVQAMLGPLQEFLRRSGALLVLVFKIGDTLANLTLRLLFNDLGFTNLEITFYDVGVGFFALLAGIFAGGVLYARFGLKQSVLASLWLMALTNLSFAGLAALGHSNAAMGAAVGFENFASGIGGVVVVAYLSALCDLRYTAMHYALLSAAASVLGRLLSGTTAGQLIEVMGYVNFYLLTTVVALPGIVLFWVMLRTGLVDRSIGSAGTVISTPGGRSGA